MGDRGGLLDGAGVHATWVDPRPWLQGHHGHSAALAEEGADDQGPDSVNFSQQPPRMPRSAADQTFLPTTNTGDTQTPPWEEVRSQPPNQ